jgi:beta-N-acetylhexosaminidase
MIGTDLSRKIGQLIMVGFEGTDAFGISGLIQELNLGGVILFTRNIKSADQVKKLTDSLKGISSDLLISIDQEGGSTTRLGPDICPIFPTNWQHGINFSTTGDPEPVIEQAETTAKVLKNLGINMNLAPVLDVVTVSGNEVISDRSYGNTPDIVGELGSRYIASIQDAGIIATAKHFPGHGPTNVDSHKALPSTDIGWQEIEEVHLSPFKRAVETGVDAVMTAHMVYKTIDSLPATLSAPILTGVLRNLLGFDGVIITDDLLMRAIADDHDIEESCVMAVRAGVDILLICSSEEHQRRAHTGLIEAVESGKIEERFIDEASFRIQRMKRKYGLLPA